MKYVQMLNWFFSNVVDRLNIIYPFIYFQAIHEQKRRIQSAIRFHCLEDINIIVIIVLGDCILVMYFRCSGFIGDEPGFTVVLEHIFYSQCFNCIRSHADLFIYMTWSYVNKIQAFIHSMSLYLRNTFCTKFIAGHETILKSLY